MRGCLPDRVGAFLKGMVFHVSELSEKHLLTLLSHTDLTTLSQLLAVGGVTFLASWTGHLIKRDYTRAVYPLIACDFVCTYIYRRVCV